MKTEGRRDFIRTSVALLGGLPLAALAGPAGSNQSGGLHVVCVGAHPDDPESGCGGTLLKLMAAGHKVTVVYLTRGEAGITGKSHAEAAAIRTAEAKAACVILGAAPVFFGQIDGATVFDHSAVEAMDRLCHELAPDLVLAHWPIDTHIDHQVASLLCQQAWLRAGKKFVLYFYEVCTGIQSMGFKPTDHVDITAVQAEKRKTVLCHQSQDPAAIYTTGNHDAMEQFRGNEISVRAAEAFVRMTGRNDTAFA